MLRFSLSAFRDALALVARRWRRRDQNTVTRPFRLSFAGWLATALAGTAFLALVADPVFAVGKGAVLPVMHMIGGALTDIAKSDRYLYPLGIFLILSGCIDWRALSRRARLRFARLVQTAWYFFLSIGLAELVSALLKQSFGRARPTVFADYGLAHFEPWTMSFQFASFPSGHATVAAALFASLAIYLRAPRALFAFAAVFIGSCRLLIGVHWPSDVFAGLMLGAWIAYAVAVIFARMRIVFTMDETGRIVRRPGHASLAGLDLSPWFSPGRPAASL